MLTKTDSFSFVHLTGVWKRYVRLSPKPAAFPLNDDCKILFRKLFSEKPTLKNHKNKKDMLVINE